MTTAQTAAPTVAAPAVAAPAAVAAPVESPPAEQTQAESDADFDRVFQELNAPAPAAGTETPAAGTETPAPGTEAAVAAAAAAATAAATAAAAAAAAPAAPEVPPEMATLQQQIAELQAKIDAAPAPVVPPTPAVVEVPLYSAEETGVLENHKKEWSEVAQGEALVRRGEYRQLVAYIFSQIGPQIEALSQSNAAVSTRSQYGAIKELVSDYDEVRDATLGWIDKQPEYLKTAYQQVAATGAPEDIADLIARFKKETSWKTPAEAGVAAAPAPAPAAAPAAAAPAAAPAPAVAALSAEAQAAIASLRPVATGRTELPNPADPNDFDGAFKEFAGMTSK